MPTQAATFRHWLRSPTGLSFVRRLGFLPVKPGTIRAGVNWASHKEATVMPDAFKKPSKSDMPDRRTTPSSNPEADAKGQSEGSHTGGSNNGVTSANPRLVSGDDSGDATFPLKKPR